MLELYLWLFVILLVSSITTSIYRHTYTPGIKTILDIMRFVGVVVHELAHYTLGILFGVKVGKFKVKYRSEQTHRVAPHGSVEDPEFHRNSFIQSFMMSFAPLFVSTFLLMFCLDIIFHIQTEIWIKILAILFGVSLLMGSKPSRQDVRCVGLSFKINPRYSLYQISLILISGLLVWVYIDLFFISLPFEVLYYIEYFIFLALFYFGFKSAFWVVGKIINGIASKAGKGVNSSPKFLTRKRRLKEFKKQKEKEVQW